MTHSKARLGRAADADASDVDPSDADPFKADASDADASEIDASDASDNPRADSRSIVEPRTTFPAATHRTRRSSPEFVKDARARMKTHRLGHAMRAYDEVSSTNTVAAEWIEEGAPHGAVVVADFQTLGRGRMGRSWIASAGLNLTFSVVLRPDLPSDRLGMLTISACVGVSRALDRFAVPLRTSIKWPNDIYLGGAKLCGMLLEASWNAPGRKPAVVLGVGLNVNQDEFPDDIRANATSLLVETGRIVPRAELFAAVLWELERSLERLTDDEDAVRKDYLERMMSLDERIGLRFASNHERIEGVVRGIDGSGGILLESNSQRLVFHAGEVTRSA